MRFGWFTPAYRSRVDAETAMTLARDVRWAVKNGHDLYPFWRSEVSIVTQRNWAVEHARELQMDYLFTIDSDVCIHPPYSALETLYTTLSTSDEKCVAAGIPVLLRDGKRINVQERIQPGRVYEGVVATGILMIDLNRLAELPMPWFMDELSDSGTTRTTTQDVWFANKLAKHGYSMLVDFRFPSAHRSETLLSTAPLIEQSDV